MQLSMINQRRWQHFKSNRRGYISFWLFLLLFSLSLLSEFIANDKPIVVSYQGDLYWPVFNTYPETTFGGDFPTEADYKDEYVASLIEKQGWMLWPPVRYDYASYNYNLQQPAPSPPSAENWLGTDDQARDVFARLIYGFRISVCFGLILTFLSTVIGIAAGALQGYFGGRIDLFAQRVIEIWNGMPSLFVLIILSSLVTPSFTWLLLIMLLFSWVTLVPVVRAEFFRARNFEYVRAARALGAGHSRIIFRHILPNAMVASFTFMPFILTGAITALTSLDFLGLGLPAGSPSLGELLRQGKENLHAPWLAATAFILLALMLSLLVFIGEAVRDAFDPRKSQGIV